MRKSFPIQPGTAVGTLCGLMIVVAGKFLDACDNDQTGVAALNQRDRRGGLGDMAVKRRLEDKLRDLLAPIRERRAAFARDPDEVTDVLREGTRRARAITQATLEDVRSGLGLFRLVL